MTNCKNFVRNITLTIFQIMRWQNGRSFLCDDGVHLSDNGMDILAGNFANIINSTFLNFNSQEIVHNEQKTTLAILSVQSNEIRN